MNETVNTKSTSAYNFTSLKKLLHGFIVLAREPNYFRTKI